MMKKQKKKKVEFVKEKEIPSKRATVKCLGKFAVSLPSGPN